MRILIIVAMTILATGCSLAGSKTPLTDRCPKTSPEACGLRYVECPASWPPDKGASLKSAGFWDMGFTPGAPLCGAGKNEEIDITGLVSPSDVGCTYANGAKLLISVPGTPVECWTADRKRLNTGHFNDGLVCYFKPTGDPAKDEIKITELEKLTRTSELFGLRLDMTRVEAEQALNAQGARITASGEGLIRATLSDGKEITAVSARDGKAKEIDVIATDPSDNLYPALKRRFGIPEPGAFETYHSSWSFWTGEQRIELEAIPRKRGATDIQRLRLIDQEAE
jgi:hypothetical protein